MQSGFRSRHSTETALVKVVNDLFMAADSGALTILVLLDLSAAFNTVNYAILINRLECCVGITGIVLQWFRSYLSDRRQCVSMGGYTSDPSPVSTGVPQGSILGPLLFNIYILPLGQIIRRHGVSFHSYAGDTIIFSETNVVASALYNCLIEIKAWMRQNFLQLNSNKTKVMLLGCPRQLRNLLTVIYGLEVKSSSEVRYLGVVFDASLTFKSHIRNVTKVSFFHLRNIARLHPMLPLPDAERLVHAFVSSWLDYCNALFAGVSKTAISRLQYIQNSAARF